MSEDISELNAPDESPEDQTAGPRLTRDNDPLLALRGSGRELWANEPADEYVRRLREWS